MNMLNDTDGNPLLDEDEKEFELDENGDPIIVSDGDFDTSDDYRGDR